MRRAFVSTRMGKVLRVVVAALGLGALTVPAAVAAPAEQIIIRLVDEPVTWDFDDPCTGEAVSGEGFESGVIRITDLGEQGAHVEINVRGAADFFDSEGTFVGTWTYHLRFGDQLPPDDQGAVHQIAVGPFEYADGHTAIVQVHEHEVFAKGAILKREFFKAACGG